MAHVYAISQISRIYLFSSFISIPVANGQVSIISCLDCCSYHSLTDLLPPLWALPSSSSQSLYLSNMTARVTLFTQSQILSFLSSSPPKAPPHSEGNPEVCYALYRPVPFDCRHLLQLAPSLLISLLCLICSSYKKLRLKHETFGWGDGMHRGWCLVPRARDPLPCVSCLFPWYILFMFNSPC